MEGYSGTALGEVNEMLQGIDELVKLLVEQIKSCVSNEITEPDIYEEKWNDIVERLQYILINAKKLGLSTNHIIEIKNVLMTTSDKLSIDARNEPSGKKRDLAVNMKALSGLLEKLLDVIKVYQDKFGNKALATAQEKRIEQIKKETIGLIAERDWIGSRATGNQVERLGGLLKQKCDLEIQVTEGRDEEIYRNYLMILDENIREIFSISLLQLLRKISGEKEDEVDQGDNEGDQEADNEVDNEVEQEKEAEVSIDIPYDMIQIIREYCMQDEAENSEILWELAEKFLAFGVFEEIGNKRYLRMNCSITIGEDVSIRLANGVESLKPENILRASIERTTEEILGKKIKEYHWDINYGMKIEKSEETGDSTIVYAGREEHEARRKKIKYSILKYLIENEMKKCIRDAESKGARESVVQNLEQRRQIGLIEFWEELRNISGRNIGEEIEQKIQELDAIQKAYIYSLRMTYNELKGEDKEKAILEATYKDVVAEMEFRTLPPNQQRAKIRKWLIGKAKRIRVVGMVETIQAFDKSQIEKYIEDTTRVPLFARWKRDEKAKARGLGFRVELTGKTTENYIEEAARESREMRKRYRRHVIGEASELTGEQLNAGATAEEIYNIKDTGFGNKQTVGIEDRAYSDTVDDELEETI